MCKWVKIMNERLQLQAHLLDEVDVMAHGSICRDVRVQNLPVFFKSILLWDLEVKENFPSSYFLFCFFTLKYQLNKRIRFISK